MRHKVALLGRSGAGVAELPEQGEEAGRNRCERASDSQSPVGWSVGGPVGRAVGCGLGLGDGSSVGCTIVFSDPENFL